MAKGIVTIAVINALNALKGRGVTDLVGAMVVLGAANTGIFIGITKGGSVTRVAGAVVDAFHALTAL